MGKLVGRLKYDKKLKDNILFKEGDKGDKFYIFYLSKYSLFY